MQKLLLFVWVMLMGICAAVRAQQNLVDNGGFEAPATSAGLPGGGWWLSQGQGDSQAGVDASVAHSGHVSATVQFGPHAKGVLVSPSFAVAPGDNISFEAWIRGELNHASGAGTYAGLAFRDADRKVFQRAYFPVEVTAGSWAKVSGVAEVPPGASSAEVHLGYTNGPGTLWYDDVAAVITNSLSFSLLEGTKPWAGKQELSFRLANRGTNRFQGAISVLVGRQASSVPVSVDPGTSNAVRVPIVLGGNGVHHYTIALLDSGGTQIRQLQGKFHTQPPLVLYPACPCYHAAGQGSGETRIDARVNINPAQRAGLRLSVEVSDAESNQVQSASTDASEGDIVGLNVRVPVAKPAAFTVAARLMDRSGKELGRARTDVRVGAGEDARVTLGPDGFLRIAGEPVFPIGLYSSGRDEEMGKAGFTGTHNYGITTGEADEAINPNDAHLKELLDRSLANGLRMMVELPRRAVEAAEWQQVRRRIETFRYHPGLLCWGSEERVARGLAPLTNLAALYQLAHELDPDHPLVLGDTRDVVRKLPADRADFFPDACMDVGIWWWYPIPLKDPDASGVEGKPKLSGLLQPPSWLTSTHSQHPLWIAIQSYQQPRKDARFPTPAEYRCMAYLSIINGVKGLWFYTGSGQKDWQGKPAGLLNKPEEGHWDYVCKLVRELRTLSPVIMAPACPQKLALSPADAPIEYALRQKEGILYLLAANKSIQTQSVRFTGSLLTGKRVRVLYEAHAAVVQDDSLADDFAPLEVHVYKLE